MQFDIFTASIVAVPAIYGAFLGFQLVSGLTALWQRPIAATAPELTATDHIADVDQMEDFWASPVEVEAVAAPPAGDCDQGEPIALMPAAVFRPVAMLPAFCINAQEPEYTAADHALVETAWVQCYCNAGLGDVIVPFKRPFSATQQPLQQHPALEGLTVHQLRKLGTALKIRGAARWNKATAIEVLTRHYHNSAA